MRQKRGRSRLRRWANSPRRSVPAYSSAPSRSDTANDISDARVVTPRCRNSAVRFG